MRKKIIWKELSVKNALSKKDRIDLIDQIADEIMDIYQEAFKKLAK